MATTGKKTTSRIGPRSAVAWHTVRLRLANCELPWASHIPVRHLSMHPMGPSGMAFPVVLLLLHMGRSPPLAEALLRKRNDQDLGAADFRLHATFDVVP